MPIRLYNTLTKTKEEFKPLDASNVRMYVCGPTVYDFAHIGNARPAIVFDLLYRLLRHEYGADHVTYVRNITDVDDKINARALRDFPNLPLNDAIRSVTEKTEAQYHADVAALGCLPPTHEPRATAHIPQMIAIIETLIARGHAYPAGGEVLFDTQSMPDYGALSRRKLDEQQDGARVAVDAHKKHPHDFVLWKLSAENEPGWPSPWGVGRPGWHIECSAMSAALLGNVFDIHGGGLDLIFPHHENEIAQSRCAHGTPAMANVWMHNGFLQVEGEKMSKSLGNFFTIRELLNDYAGGALRLAMLQTQYRQPIDWTKSKVQESFAELRNWTVEIYGSKAEHDLNLRKAQKKAAKPHPTVYESLSDDLNTSQALTALRDLYKRRADEDYYAALIESCEFLGLINPKTIGAYATGVGGKNLGTDLLFSLHDTAEKLRVSVINGDVSRQLELEAGISSKGVGLDISYDGYISFNPLGDASPFDGGTIQRQIDARNAARAAKDFQESDRIRDELLSKGIVLKDGPAGTTWDVKR